MSFYAKDIAKGLGRPSLSPAAPIGQTVSAAVAPQKTNPILEAAQIQADALQGAIPLFDPFMQSGLQGLGDFTQASTPQGLSDVIDQIMNGSLFAGLVDERRNEVESMLASGGLMRSGAAMDEAAAIPTDVAFAIENLLAGRQGGLTEVGLTGTSNIADLTTRVAEAIASGILGVEAQKTARDAASDTNRASIIGAGLGALGSAFSDPRLKENVQAKGKIGPLTLVSWDWIAEAKGTVIENMPTIGFMSTDIKEHFPEVVGNYGGYDVIDYPRLIEKLNAVTDC